MTADTLHIEPAGPGGIAFDPASWDIPHEAPFLCELRVDHSLVSRAVPHVNNIGFVQWVDRVAELHADAAGYTRAELLRRGVMWFVVRHEIDYLAGELAESRIQRIAFVSVECGHGTSGRRLENAVAWNRSTGR